MKIKNPKEFLIHTVLDNKYIPHEPTIKQAEALLRLDKEVFYGGAGGGGKSDFLLMAALQFVDITGYNALILMETVSNLNKPEALMNRSFEWLAGTDAVWRDKLKAWIFPSGARLDFGYIQYENDKYQYKTAAYQFIGFDELTQFSLTMYTYLFTRLRRLKDFPVPLRVRSASNPDGPGVVWVKHRFIRTDKDGQIIPGGKFIPAKLQDNPHIDQEAYIDSLSLTDPLTRRRIQDGEWVLSTGEIFKRHWFKFRNDYNRTGRTVRYWDLAATEKNNKNDPDFAIGGKFHLELDNSVIYLHRIKVRENPGEIIELMKQTALADGFGVTILIEQEPGSSGKLFITSIKEKLVGFHVVGIPSSGSKSLRANPVASHAYDGKVFLMEAEWNEDFLDTCEAFPEGHDDDVDVLSGAFNYLIQNQIYGDIISGSTTFENFSLEDQSYDGKLENVPLIS